MILAETKDSFQNFGASLIIVILSVLARNLILVHVCFLDCKVVKLLLLAGCYKSTNRGMPNPSLCSAIMFLIDFWPYFQPVLHNSFCRSDV